MMLLAFGYVLAAIFVAGFVWSAVQDYRDCPTFHAFVELALDKLFRGSDRWEE